MKITSYRFNAEMQDLITEFNLAHATAELRCFNQWLADFCGWLGQKQSEQRKLQQRHSICFWKQRLSRFWPFA